MTVTRQRFDAWHLPAGEAHLQGWMRHANRRVDGRLTYQYHKYEAALAAVDRRRRAVDVGAHCGLWSFWMARDFADVQAFEPEPSHVACWRLNMVLASNAVVHQTALGATSGRVSLTTGPASSGDTRVVAGDDCDLRTLDSFALEDVDLLKIDCEGYELFVLQGAEQTIARCKPTVIVEQKPGHGAAFGIGDRDGLAWLLERGGRKVWEQSGDVVVRF